MKATIWNDLHPNDPPRYGLIILDAPSKAGDGTQYVACGGEDSERLNETARRIVALWNAAEELELTTAKIAEGEIQQTFRLAESRAGVVEAALERIEKLEAEKAEMGKVLLLVKVMIDSHAKHLTRGSGYYRLVEIIKNQGEAR